jgi:hypothetical protein
VIRAEAREKISSRRALGGALQPSKFHDKALTLNAVLAWAA